MVQKSAREENRNREIAALEAEMAEKAKRLNKSKLFLEENETLITSLEKIRGEHPDYVKEFFHRFSYPIGKTKAVHMFLSKAPDENTRDVLWSYAKYVARFGVTLRLRRKVPHFKRYLLPTWGSTFELQIKEGQFVPARQYPGGDEPHIYFFESGPTTAPAFVRPLIEAGNAKFVQINDEDGSSLLTRLEVFAYAPDAITFVAHQAEQPYLFCLIGENVTNETWRSAGKVVTAFQRKFAGIGKAGRPADIKRLKKTYQLLRKKGPKKNVAVDVSKGPLAKDTSSSQSYVSRKSKPFRK